MSGLTGTCAKANGGKGGGDGRGTHQPQACGARLQGPGGTWEASKGRQGRQAQGLAVEYGRWGKRPGGRKLRAQAG